MTRSLLTSVLLAVLALGATACGGSDDPDDASSTPSESTSSATESEEPSEPTSSADPSEAPSDAPSESAPVPGDEGEEGGGGGGAGSADDAAVVSSMQTSLNALVDGKTTAEQKAARVVGGGDLAPLFRQFEQGAGDAQVTFTVEDPVVEGRDATALVGAFDRGRPVAAPARTPFVLADGEWRLERATVCVFAGLVGLECPPG